MTATIKMIAQKAQVSIATVSMVLNKKDQRISDKTREKILQIAAELNYQPNVIAQSLVTSETKTIGLLIPDVANPFFSEIAKCIEIRLSKENYSLFLCNSNNNKKIEQAYIQNLLNRNIDGLIISSVHIKSFLESEILRKTKTPFLIFDRLTSRDDFHTISIADKTGGRLAAKELLSNHHQKCACLCGSLDYQNIKNRIDGFKEVLDQQGLTIPDAFIIESDLTIMSGYESARKLIAPIKDKQITALFCSNDLIAFGAYKAFKEHNIRIPNDISVIGFDNIAFSDYMMPPLTTIEQPISSIGKKAAEMILNIIHNKPKTAQKYTFPVRLLKRESIKHL